MSQQVGIDLNLDASQYTQAAGMAMASTSALEQSLGRLSVAAGGVNRALNTAAPSKSHIAAFGGFTAAAVASQASLSGLAATQAVAGQSSSKLSATIRQMARDMPIGQRSAQQIVETVNQLGISGKGSEGHIAALSKTIGKLQGATGEFGPALAQGITQIDRAFGNQNLDPKRLSATADSLTTVSKKAGVSASGILDFANAIGPMTKQAGIGESATLGIAAAFGQIGQDGNAAATAVNKMLTDMNRSVRDGSPQMAIYSNAVGMTRQNFEALFKLNPSQALVQVTKAIGSNGAQGQRVLESLNLDGVRTQRALTAISGSGQLENLINEAVGSRGNGSTSKGAAAAFGGVADQFQKAGTAAGQVAVALGSTLLAPLGLFAKAVSSVTGHIAGLVTGGVGHSVLTTAAYGGLGLLAARRLFGIGTGAAVARQIGTSGPIGSIFAGLRRGRGEELRYDREGNPMYGGMWGRTSGRMQAAADNGTIHEGVMGGINSRLYNTFRGIGSRMGPGGEGPGLLRTVAGAGLRGAFWATGAYSRMMTAQAQMAEEPDPTRRSAIFDRQMRRGGISADLMPPTMRASMQNREMPSREDFRTFGTNLRNSAKEFGTVGAAARGLGGAFGSTMRVLATTTGAVGRGALGVGRGLLSTVGGMSGLAVMGGITAVTLGLQSKNRAAAENKADTEHSSTMSPTEIYDKYMESVGRAGQSTQNFASQLDQTTRTMVAGTTSMKQALTLSSADIGQATATKKSQVNDFGSSSSSGDVAAQVKLLMGSSNDPAAMQAIKLDLARQYNPDFVKSVLSQVSNTAPSYTGLNIKNPSVSTPKGASAGTDFDSIRQVVSGVTGMNIQGGPGGNKESASDYYESNFSKLNDTFGFGGGKGSGLMSGKERISDKGRKQMDLLQQSISTQYANQQGVYGPDYAGQQQLQSINTAMDTAAHSGNEPAVNELGDRFARDLMGKDYKVPRITSSDITKHGGYVQALAAKDKGFASKLSGMKGISLTPGQGLQGNEVENARSQMISGAGVNPDMAGLFNNTLSTSVGKVGNGETKYQTLSNARSAMQSYMAQPSDTSKQISATEGTVTAMQAMGHSLADITEQASKTAASLGDVTDAGYQVSKAIIAEAAFRTQAKQPFQTSSQNISDRLDNAAALMKTPGTDDESKARRQQGKEDYATAEGDLATALKARISLYYQYNTSVKRAAEDYTKTTTRAEEDFQLSQTYAAQDYYLQREYQVEDYNKTVSRDYEDFRTTEARANRDFEITETRSQEDYLTTRQRAIRDFNKTLAREIEDQTKALYDPYHRIQTAAVWDATSLVSNMAEQNYAILKQAQQLKQLRKQGLTDQAIQQLDLTNPNNAQQLNQISGDISNNPKLLAQLNSQAKLRQGIGSMLVEDPSNKDIKRAREDFNTQLKDMEYDFNKSMSRSKSDFDRQMGDQVVDFDKSMVRMAVDFQTSLDRSDYQYGVSVARAQYEFDLTMARMEDDYQTSLTRMHDDLIFSTMEITGGVDDLWKTLQDTMKGQNDSANNVMKDGLNKTYDIIKNRKDDFRGVYKDLFPYDLSKLFAGGTGGPDQSIGGGSQGHAGHVGGPYAPYANAGAQAAMYNNVGSSGHNSFGEMVKGAAVSQGFGEHKAGSPGTGGGWPVPDPTITQRFGQNPQPSNPGGHPGIDLAVGNGTPIAAPLSGIVVYAGWNDGYGNCVIMDNGGGRSTLYGHQQAINVHVGDKLKPGDLIGWVDSTGASTGPHLHFETRQNGQLQDPAVDLPVWQATDGLGSFDPGATARGYGVHLDFAGLDPKKYEDMTKDAHLGPWGALLALYKAEVDAAKQIKESEASSLSDSSGVKLANNTQHLDEKAYAKSLFKSFGWGDDQFDALNELWEHESNWNPTIGNLAGSGAYGIPQALPASKMASEGADWATNPDTQIRWGLKYIASAYGSPSAAWAHWQARVPINGRDVGNWYGNGGIFNGPQRIGIGERGPEAVIPMNQMGVGVLAQAFGQAVTAAELSQMVQSGHAEKVVYHSETTTIDNSTHYEGDITVKADDPLTLKRQLEAAQRAKNLTRGRTPGRS